MAFASPWLFLAWHSYDPKSSLTREAILRVERVDNSGRYSVAHFTRGPTTTLSTLRIASLVSDDFGSYECQAKNSHGEAKAVVNLAETNVPIPEAAFAGVSGRSSVLSVLLSSLLLVLALL